MTAVTTHQGHGRVSTFTGEAGTFSKTTYLDSDPGNAADLQFWISHNTGLTPAVILTPEHSGDIVVTRRLRDPIPLTADIHVQFDQVFDDWHDGDAFHRVRRLVARSTLPDPGIAPTIAATLDDLLLLAGLPMRKRTVCYGWHLATASRMIEHFRGNSGAPGNYHYPSLGFGLVNGVDYHSFLTRAWDRFRSSPDQGPIRNLIYAAVPADNPPLERDTLALFSAIENYLASYRRRAGLANVIEPGRAWGKLDERLRSAIQSCTDPPLNTKQRSYLYQNLSGLNRPPLGAVFTAMVGQTGLVTHDLWPMFDSQDGPSIYKIRNRLVHGDFPETEVFTLSIVNEHLRWLIDRMLLGLFEWPVDQSDVAPALVERHYVAAREWRTLRDKLRLKLL